MKNEDLWLCHKCKSFGKVRVTPIQSTVKHTPCGDGRLEIEFSGIRHCQKCESSQVSKGDSGKIEPEGTYLLSVSEGMNDLRVIN